MREDIVVQLQQRSWFRATAPSIQQRLCSLPEYCEGFLRDLARRPDTVGSVRLINLDALLIPDTGKIFGIFVVFLVQSLDDPSNVYWYQYFSWAQGPESGAKGVLLVRRRDRITHLVTLQGFKFAAGAVVPDTFGGFANPDEQGVQGMLRSFERELREELGAPTLRIVEVIPLGALQSDAGMTNSRPALFAAVIDGGEAERLDRGELANPDAHELKNRIVITPVEVLWGLEGAIMCNDDPCFLACVARLGALGILRPPSADGR